MRNCPPRCEQPTQIYLLPPRPDATLCSNSINSARSDTEKIGPLALPYGLLLTMAAIGLSWFIARRVARTAGIDAEPVLTRMLLVGLVAARLAFGWQWRGPYFDAPLSILDIRHGGWNAATGLAAACFYGLYRMRNLPGLRKPLLAAVLTTGLVWALGSFAITMGSRDAVPLPQLSLTSLDGRAVPLAGFVGKLTVVNLGATRWPPCRREMPVLQQAQGANPDVNFVFVNQGEKPDVIQSWSTDKSWRCATCSAMSDCRPARRLVIVRCRRRCSSTRGGNLSARASASCRRPR